MSTSPEKIESLLGFAARAGKLVYGADNIVLSKRVRVVLVSGDLQENTRKKLLAYGQERNVPLIVSKKPLCEILKRDGVKAVGVTDKQMASAMGRYVSDNFIWMATEVD